MSFLFNMSFCWSLLGIFKKIGCLWSARFDYITSRRKFLRTTTNYSKRLKLFSDLAIVLGACIVLTSLHFSLNFFTFSLWLIENKPESRFKVHKTMSLCFLKVMLHESNFNAVFYCVINRYYVIWPGAT